MAPARDLTTVLFQKWQWKLIARVPLLGSPELMRRIAGTLGLLGVIRLGLVIPLPDLIPQLDMRKAVLSCKPLAAVRVGKKLIVYIMQQLRMQ